jgi:hypothetical protein
MGKKKKKSKEDDKVGLLDIVVFLVFLLIIYGVFHYSRFWFHNGYSSSSQEIEAILRNKPLPSEPK